MSLITPPKGYQELLKLGDPRKFLKDDGTIDSHLWEVSLGLVKVDFPEPLPISFAPAKKAYGMRVHPISKDAWAHAFSLLEHEGLWRELHTFGGSYNFRLQRGSDSKISLHSWGLAADFDTLNLPLGSDKDMHPGVVQVFESIGFTYGGRWMRPDPQHIQFCTNY